MEVDIIHPSTKRRLQPIRLERSYFVLKVVGRIVYNPGGCVYIHPTTQLNNDEMIMEGKTSQINKPLQLEKKYDQKLMSLFQQSNRLV